MMPDTRIIKISVENPDIDEIQNAVKVLKDGGVVAFPTETVYGLGADALNEKAVEKVFRAKGRPADNPLIVHTASLESCYNYTDNIPDVGIILANKFWPGPLTLIVRKKTNVPKIVTANLDTVALRVPDHKVTLKLLELFKGGIVGPSANISGRPSPTCADHVFQDMNGKIDLIIDAGPTTVGIESTVLDVTVDPPAILRYGGLDYKDIEREIGIVVKTAKVDILKRSPGTRYKHYSPKARVVLFPKGNREKLSQLVSESGSRKEKCGAITYSNISGINLRSTLHIAIKPSVEYIARYIFKALRDLDDKNVDVIFVEKVEEEGLGAAIMDRLRKAAALD